MSVRWIVSFCAALLVLTGCAAESEQPVDECVGAECNGYTAIETGCDDLRETWGQTTSTNDAFGDLRGQLTMYRGVQGVRNHRCADVYWGTFKPSEANAADFYVVVVIRGYDELASEVRGEAGSSDPVSTKVIHRGVGLTANVCVEAISGDMPKGQMTRRMCMDTDRDNLPVPPFDEETF